MTDFTNDASWTAQDGKLARSSSTEYKVYFGLILLAALPICAASWTYSLVRHAGLPEQGPIRKAWSEAHSITPRIFWG